MLRIETDWDEIFLVFPEAFTEKHSPQTAHNLLQEEVARAEEQSEVI